MVEDGGEMRERVVAPLRLLPAPEQIVGVRHRVGTATGPTDPFESTGPAGTQGVWVGHGVILPGARGSASPEDPYSGSEPGIRKGT
ncbi:hypothetical protein GCM10009549_41180 [Streptomyces thermoalcalitolerans]|uniref:Uncharacterized protein n=1 Tax=Streptomyces thermoalcalitolerans TaxID=65605 RepID=A0ABN1P333_9ACTN